MSSSSRPAAAREASVLTPDAALAATPVDQRDLRSGEWTRFGGTAVLGDATTEHTLSHLAETVRSAARAQGYATGWSEGRRKAEAEARVAAAEAEATRLLAEQRREDEHQTALAALGLAAQRLHDTVEQARYRLAGQATGLAYELTEELVGRAIADGDAEAVCQRVLAALPSGDALVRVHLHPDHAASAAIAPLAERGIAVVADPTLVPGDALVETDERVLDLRVSGALERVREVLR